MFTKYCEICSKNSLSCFYRKQEGITEPSIRKVLNVLEKSFHLYKCNVSFLLDETGLEKEDLYMMLFKQFSFNPKVLIENLKIEYSVHLFKEGVDNVEVAINSGFGHVRTLQDVLHRRLGCSPQKIRDSFKNNLDKTELFHNYIEKLWQ